MAGTSLKFYDKHFKNGIPFGRLVFHLLNMKVVASSYKICCHFMGPFFIYCPRVLYNS